MVLNKQVTKHTLTVSNTSEQCHAKRPNTSVAIQIRDRLCTNSVSLKCELNKIKVNSMILNLN